MAWYGVEPMLMAVPSTPRSGQDAPYSLPAQAPLVGCPGDIEDQQLRPAAGRHRVLHTDRHAGRYRLTLHNAGGSLLSHLVMDGAESQVDQADPRSQPRPSGPCDTVPQQ